MDIDDCRKEDIEMASSSEHLPVGVRTTEFKGEIITGALKLTDKLSFSDFAKTSWAFKVQDGIELAKAEKILIDNLWYAHNRKDTKHIIAALNGLSVYLSRKNGEYKCYVVFNGLRPGIYKSWAAVTQVTKGSNSQYKKYNSAHAAITDAQIYIGQNFYIDPDMKGQTPEGPSNTETVLEAHTFNKEIINLKKQILDLEEKNQLLQERIIMTEKKEINQELQISYAGATSDEGLSKEERILINLEQIKKELFKHQKEVEEKLETIVYNTYSAAEGVNILDSGPSDPWVEWLDNRIGLAQELRPGSIRPPQNVQIKNLEGQVKTINLSEEDKTRHELQEEKKKEGDNSGPNPREEQNQPM
ncbi:Ribonuclease H1, N-terminal [Parasponia andersonii]|uniref:Ribonuclease H1, N-terminal n=1 Tax=Parasponia andersonii TaxID=3476 RepID=A0A2P5BM67_PARAD|nr:Ribonuclease H1, N-terminal [Parasponia andersonii]